MKGFFCFILLLSVLCGLAQTVTTLDNNNILNIKWHNIPRLLNGAAASPNTKLRLAVHRSANDVSLLYVLPNNQSIAPSEFAGVFFDDMPGYKQGVALWRYKPWNSWTKPMAMQAASKMPEDDVQFYYWQYADGVYGAALPLSGNGFRTTLGSKGLQWGSKAVSYAATKIMDSIPAMAIAFGKDPFELFERIYSTALKAMGKGENLRVKKTFPEPFNYMGWCTWNASENGNKLNEKLLLQAAKSFSDGKFPIGWMLVDDGWFQQNDRRLQSYLPGEKQFPSGFKPMIDKLKSKYGIRYMGVWHAFNGLWNGIDPNAALGKHFAPALFSWQQKERPDKDDAAIKTYHFIKPDSDSLNVFYSTWHRYLKEEGFDFLKVDNQSVTEKMAVHTYPLFTLSDSMHKVFYRSVNNYFNGAVINCMDMTADAYLNFGSSAVARASEDYFPYQPGETYNLQRGNAAAHVLQAIYNSIYFGQMVYPDFDLFQSHNPNAVFHAIARAINCGPIYITDNIGEQKFAVLRPLVYADGRIIKSATPLLPTEDCLFQVQEPKLFKASSMVANAGLLGVWNAADANAVEGYIKPGDVRGIKGESFVLYEHFSQRLQTAKRSSSYPVKLNRMGYQLYYVVAIKNGFAPLGLTEKYNAPATILKEVWNKNKITISLGEGGLFKAYSTEQPTKILVNGRRIRDYNYKNRQLIINIAQQKNPVITIYWRRQHLP
ncbi:MAG: Sip1-related alpha-galactosidase [Ferruginibacter sp.]